MKLTVTAVVGAALATGAAFGLHLSPSEQHAILLDAQILAPVLIAAEALFNHNQTKLQLQRESQDFYAAQAAQNVSVGQAAFQHMAGLEARVATLENRSVPTVGTPDGPAQV